MIKSSEIAGSESLCIWCKAERPEGGPRQHADTGGKLVMVDKKLETHFQHGILVSIRSTKEIYQACQHNF